MEFEWDDAKDAANRTKHGVGFDIVWELDWIEAQELTDTRNDYGEIRRQAYLYRVDRLYVCIYTERDGARRIISLRKANRREEQRYGW